MTAALEPISDEPTRPQVSRRDLDAAGGPSSEARRRPASLALTALGVLAIAMRVLVIFAPPADLAAGGTAEFEELLRGMTALELIEGPVLELSAYQWNANWGGSLVISILATPFFAAFGPSLVALRLSTLVFSILGLVVLFKLLDRFVSRRAAWVGGLLFAVAPPGYAILSSAAWGTHVETNVLALALLYLYLRNREERALRPWRELSLGLLAGFGIYFGLTMILIVGFLVILEGLRDPWFWRKRTLAVRLLGFGVGLVPLLWHGGWSESVRLLASGGTMREVVGFEAGLVQSASRAWPALGGDVGRALYFPDLGALDGTSLGMGFAAILLMLALGALWSGRRHLAGGGTTKSSLGVISASFLLLYLAVYACSGFEIRPELGAFGMRYLLPVVPWSILAAAVSLDELMNRGERSRALARVLVALWVALSLTGTLQRCELDSARSELERPGYDSTGFSKFIAERIAADDEELRATVDRVLERREDPLRTDLLFGIGQIYKQYSRPDVRLPDRAHLLEAEHYQRALNSLHAYVPARYKPYFEPPTAGETFFGNEARHRFESLYLRAQRQSRQPAAPVEASFQRGN